MAAEKVTTMILKVDLQCPCCYKKVKKILCKFPQIRNQVFDEKANKVIISVVCCSPEKIRDKLCCKGCKVIKSIEIVEPPKPKPKEPEKPKQPEKPKEPEKPKQPEKPKEPEKPNVIVIEKPKQPEKPKVVVTEKPKEPEKPKVVTFQLPEEPEKPKSNGKGDKPAPPPEKPKEAPKPAPPKNLEPAPGPPKMPDPMPIPAQGYPPAFPVQTCCGPCYEGYGGGPCYHGYGVPPPPQPCYDGYYGYGGGYHGRGTHVTRCDYYFSEENSQGCSIM